MMNTADVIHKELESSCLRESIHFLLFTSKVTTDCIYYQKK